MPPTSPAAAAHGEMGQPTTNGEPDSAAGASDPSSSPAAIPTLGAILSQTNPGQAVDLPSSVLPIDTVVPQAIGVAARPLPQTADSECILKARPRVRRLLRKTKLKSRARKILLPKFILKGIVGSTAADLVHPLVNPKASPAIPVVSTVPAVSAV